MNESIKNMIERRSVRGYKPDMIPKEDLDLILEAGTYAATGMGNFYDIFVIFLLLIVFIKKYSIHIRYCIIQSE